MSFQNGSSFTTSLPCPKDRSEGKRRQEELPHTFTVHNYSIVVVNIHKKSIKKLGGHKGAVAKNETEQNTPLVSAVGAKGAENGKALVSTHRSFD